MDVGIFAPLSLAYKNHVQRVTRLGTSYSIDKVNFLELYRLVKQEVITPLNIQKAWAAIGLSPFNPQVVLKHFPPPEPEPEPEPEQCEQYNITIRPTTPPEGTMSYSGPNGPAELALTPANTLQVQQLLRQVKADGVNAEEALQKVSKAAIFAMAERVLYTATNSELLELNRRKERKANRAKGNYSNARYIN